MNNNLSQSEVDALFDTPVRSGFPEPIWVKGSCKIENGRTILSIQLTPDLKPYFKNNQISFTVIKKKKPDMYGRTHSVCINQDEWPAVKEINSKFLTLAEVKNEHVINFTLTLDQLNSLKYEFTPKQTNVKGLYVKLELVDNGMQVGVFRFMKEVPKEATGFKMAQKIVSAQTPTVTKENAKSVANKTVDDFLSDL